MPYRSALIHISDIECGEKNRCVRPHMKQPYLDAAQQLVKDVRSQLVGEQYVASTQIGLVITGDIAGTGTDEEYEQAAQVIESIRDSLHIPRDQVALIPGNHDVNRAECRRAFTGRFPDLSVDSPTDREHARLLPEKLRGFGGLLKRICNMDFPGPESVLAFKGLARLGVAMVGFDTTYPITFHEDDNFGAIRKETITKEGKRSLDGLLSHDERLIPIAMLHHCLTPLRDQTEGDNSYLHNASEALVWLQAAGFSVFICGHEHQSRATADILLANQVFVTGSYGLNAKELVNCYRGSHTTESNKYQIILLAPEDSSRLLLRRLQEPGAADAKWIGDNKGHEPAVDLHLYRPHLVATPANDLKSAISLLVSHPSPLPRDNRKVVSIALGVPETHVAAIRQVVYQLAGRQWVVSERDGGFPMDVELEEVDGLTVEATVITELGPIGPLSAPIPAPR